MFNGQERITVGPRAVADVVGELQDYQLLAEIGAAHDWDLMGHAYEQYTSIYLKRERGQYFTNRLVIDLLVNMINPDYMDIILDPAGGSGGFLTGVMRYVRNNITNSGGSVIAKERQLDRHRTNLFMVEISKRLVKVAKTAMILNGDGHTGMTAGDSLGAYEEFDKTIVARANRGVPTAILTNPPFAGVGEGRVSHEDVLRRFEVGRKWVEREGTFAKTRTSTRKEHPLSFCSSRGASIGSFRVVALESLCRRVSLTRKHIGLGEICFSNIVGFTL